MSSTMKSTPTARVVAAAASAAASSGDDKKKSTTKATKTTAPAAAATAARKSGRKRKEVDYNEEKNEQLEAVATTAAVSGYKKPKGGLKVLPKRQPLPSRDKNGVLHFADHPEFTPNLTPKEILQAGSFGGTYFRSISSSVTGEKYDGSNVYKEFPSDWFEGLNIKTQVTSQTYRNEINKYGVKCGGDLHMWESSGWITDLDPYGWFMWYCRFYLGRRTEDDERQISRGNKVHGATSGRFRLQLQNKLINLKRAYDDYNVSPVIRQTLLHWGYELTEKDFAAYKKKKGVK